MCQEKEEESQPTWKIAWMHEYEDCIKKSKERLIKTASNNIKNI